MRNSKVISILSYFMIIISFIICVICISFTYSGFTMDELFLGLLFFIIGLLFSLLSIKMLKNCKKQNLQIKLYFVILSIVSLLTPLLMLTGPSEDATFSVFLENIYLSFITIFMYYVINKKVFKVKNNIQYNKNKKILILIFVMITIFLETFLLPTNFSETLAKTLPYNRNFISEDFNIIVTKKYNANKNIFQRVSYFHKFNSEELNSIERITISRTDASDIYVKDIEKLESLRTINLKEIEFNSGDKILELYFQNSDQNSISYIVFEGAYGKYQKEAIIKSNERIEADVSSFASEIYSLESEKDVWFESVCLTKIRMGNSFIDFKKPILLYKYNGEMHFSTSEQIDIATIEYSDDIELKITSENGEIKTTGFLEKTDHLMIDRRN